MFSVPPPPPAPTVQESGTLLPVDRLPAMTVTWDRWRALDHICAGQPVNSEGKLAQAVRHPRLDEALINQWSQDLYATMYGVAKRPPHPSWPLTFDDMHRQPLWRLTTAAPEHLVEAGWLTDSSQVVGWGLIVEVDLKDLYALDNGVCAEALGKVPWSPEWRQRAQEGYLRPAAEAWPLLGKPSCFWTSRNGFRLCWIFSRPIPILGSGGLLDRLRGTMIRCYTAGLPVDKACKDWTRLQRLPKVVRPRDDGSTECSSHNPSFALSWGRVDFAREDVAIDQVLVHDPESFPCSTEMSIREYIEHPQWHAIQSVYIDHAGRLTGTVSMQLQIGDMPDDDQAHQILYSVKDNGHLAPTLIHGKVRDQVRKVAKRVSEENSALAQAAGHVSAVLWEHARVDLNPDGTSNIHDNSYRLLCEICWICYQMLSDGTDRGGVTCQVLYALLLEPVRRANEARRGEGGFRDDVELRSEVWRMCRDVLSKRLGKRKEEADQAREVEEQKEIDRRSELGNSELESIIEAQVRAQAGIPREVPFEMRHHFVIGTEVGSFVCACKPHKPEVYWQGPASKWTELSSRVRDAGHNCMRIYNMPVDPTQLKTLKKEAEFFIEHATVADRLVFSRTRATHPEYKMYPDGRRELTMVTKRGGLKAIEPEHDDEIAEYLQLLGGEHVDVFLDWLACFPMINRPLPALYLYGKKSAGKGMLIEALSLLTENGKYANLVDSLGRFQDEYLDTFLLVADEDTSTPDGRYQKDVVGVLRRMVGGQSGSVKIKGLKGVHIEGEYRIIITANNPDVFDIQKDMSVGDVEALNGRIFFLDVMQQSDQLVNLLESKGGRYGNEHGPGTEATQWLERIAKHVMWLHENRQVKYGNRFLIDAPATPWHENLRIQSNNGRMVCRIIGQLIDEMGKNRSVPAIYIDHSHQQVLISIAEMTEHIERTYPSLKNWRSACERLTTERVRRRLAGADLRKDPHFNNRRWCHVLDIATVMRFLDQEGFHVGWREVFGDEMWAAVAPADIQYAYRPESETPPAGPPPPFNPWTISGW